GDIPEPEQYVAGPLARNASQEFAHQVVQARKNATKYLDECARRIAEYSPRMVGFTTTFHQTCASLAVAKRLKALPNPPIIVFGGANCEGEMGLQLLQSFPWIDYVCCGESDLSFPKLLDHIFRDGPGDVPGVLARGKSTLVVKSDAIQNLDALPYPDFDDYFAELAASQTCRERAIHVV